MSVILDALRRVQDEGRGRDRTTAAPRRDAALHGDALLRRLAEGNEGTSALRTVPARSRVASLGLLVLALAAVVSLALWFFQPTLVSDGATPLLASLTGAGRQPARVAEPQAVPAEPRRDDSLFQDLVAAPQNAAPAPQESTAAAASMAAETQPGSRDYSDLSTQVSDSQASWAAPEPAAEEPAMDAGYLDLSSDFSAPEPELRDSAADVSIESTEAARVPRELVDPGVRAAFAEGVRLHKQGDAQGAQEAYERALKFDPYNAKVNANLGVLFESTDRLQLAERHLRQSVAIEPGNANARNNLGVVLYRMGSYESALTEFNRTVELDPDRLDAYINKGLIFTRWGRYEDAESAFLQVIARDAGNALAHYNLGLVYEETDQIGRALDSYYQFLAIGGSDHPEISKYLSDHLPWLEARLDAGDSRQSR